MFDADTTSAIRQRAALDLLRLKAVSQMREGKTTCLIDEEDVKEILLVAGLTLEKELEVM